MFNNVKKHIRKYFGFSESETNGFLIFIPLIVFILFAPSLLKQYLLSTSGLPDPESERILREWVAESDAKIQLKDTSYVESKTFDFDPNLASVDDFTKLGFKEKIAHRIGNYREKGGRFYKKEDLLKIYGISQSRIKELWGNIKIAKKTKGHQQVIKPRRFMADVKKPRRSVQKTDLNLATSDSLVKIRGIGPVLSERILKYRNSLGGFVSTNQLSEVYGLKEDVIERILERYKVDVTSISGLDMNSDSTTYLVKHPYISYSLAKVIVAYRQQHGFYHSIDEIRNIKLMNDSLFHKLSPYLKVEVPELIE